MKSATTEIKFKIKNSLLLSLKEKKESFAKNMLFNNALVLYRQGKLSLGKAAELAGYSKLDFIFKLQEQNEAIFKFSAEEINEMIDAADIISKRLIK